MSERPGIFGWLARIVGGFLGLATNTPTETRELREEIASRRSEETAEETDSPARLGGP